MVWDDREITALLDELPLAGSTSLFSDRRAEAAPIVAEVNRRFYDRRTWDERAGDYDDGLMTDPHLWTRRSGQVRVSPRQLEWLEEMVPFLEWLNRRNRT